MRELGVEEAGIQFSALLELVEQGEEIRFVKNGETIAELVSPSTAEERHRARAARADQAFAEMRERVKAEGVKSIGAATMKEWINEGRL